MLLMRLVTWKPSGPGGAPAIRTGGAKNWVDDRHPCGPASQYGHQCLLQQVNICTSIGSCAVQFEIASHSFIQGSFPHALKACSSADMYNCNSTTVVTMLVTCVCDGSYDASEALGPATPVLAR